MESELQPAESERQWQRLKFKCQNKDQKSKGRVLIKRRARNRDKEILKDSADEGALSSGIEIVCAV